jgi:hypothetical protein
LIDALGIDFADPSSHVVAFVDEDAALILHTIGVRSSGSTAHQDDAVAPPKRKFMPRWRLMPSSRHISRYEITSPGANTP